MNDDFKVEVDAYSGPLDLLLYLAKVNEVEITDIPISHVTAQYLHYIEIMQLLNMELGSEFLVMASTLMEIKSRTLIPVEDVEDEEEIADPRLELIQQLIEYRKIKEAAKDLNVKAAEHSQKFPRSIKKTVVDGGFSMDSVDLWDLMSAFDAVIKQISTPTSREIVDDDVPIHVHIERLVERLKESSPLSFESLFDGVREKGKLISIFLALLELTRRHQVMITQEQQYGDIIVAYKGEGEEPPEAPADEQPILA